MNYLERNGNKTIHIKICDAPKITEANSYLFSHKKKEDWNLVLRFHLKKF